MDGHLRYQPSFELRKEDGTRVAKIGGHVVSYHVVGPYPGWSTFRIEIEKALLEAITRLRSPQFSRIGFRYINIFRPEEHHIQSPADTNIVLKLGKESLTKSVSVNYNRDIHQKHSVTVKIATPDLVIGDVVPGFSLLCDIDVGTKKGVSMSGFDDAMAWIEEAHTLEKEEFFLNITDAGDQPTSGRHWRCEKWLIPKFGYGSRVPAAQARWDRHRPSL